MEDLEFIEELNLTFKNNGLSKLLTTDASERFLLLTKRMLEENEKYNLTAIKEPKRIILNHYCDCAVISENISEGASVADIGCGAGFPTLPLAILRPDLKITGIDSTAKRINYVSETARLLGLSNIRAIAMRAEDGARMPDMRERFDYSTARAVAELRILTELCLPYVKIGGKMIAMKGRSADEELSCAMRSIEVLGGKLETKKEIALIGDGETLSHPLIVIKKAKPTDKAYPRPYAKILKKPL